MLNVVLVGNTGNGKSATANSILREKAFESELSFEGVTTQCQQRTTVFTGRDLNVIDTPAGLFDASYDSEHLASEIATCMSMAEGGIHAVLIVLTPNRFTKEDEAVSDQLLRIFGDKLFDYIIVVFTHGDELPADETNLNNRLAKAPASLKKLLERCNNRNLLFDNKTMEELKKFRQIRLLVDIVDDIAMNNNREPYTDAIFLEYLTGFQLSIREKVANLGCSEENAEFEKLKLDQTHSISWMVVAKLMERKLKEDLSNSYEKISKLERNLEAPRIKAEEERYYADLKANKAKEQRIYAEIKLKEAEEMRKNAELKVKKAEEERKQAEEKAMESEKERKIAEEKAGILEKQQKCAMEEAKKSEEEHKRLQAKIHALNERLRYLKKSSVDPKKPKKPVMSAFFVFMEDFRKACKVEKRNLTALETSLAAGERWRSLSDEEKASYKAKAEKRKAEYKKELELEDNDSKRPRVLVKVEYKKEFKLEDNDNKRPRLVKAEDVVIDVDSGDDD